MMDSMEQHFITEIRLKLRLLEVQIFHYGLCKYGHATSFKITDAEGKEIDSTSGKATTDGDVEKVSYSGEAATLTITCVGDGEAYLIQLQLRIMQMAGEAESFTMMLDDIAKDGVVATGDYKYGESTTYISWSG